MTDSAGVPAVDGTMVWLGLDVKPEGIPFALKAIDQWVTWRAEPKANGDGMSKVPYQVNGAHASSTNSATWTDYATVIAAVLEDELPSFSGPGFAVQMSNGLAILDFDHVRNALTGIIDPDVLKAVLYLNTYAEVSPSGTGIRVVGHGTLDRAVSGKTLQGWSDGRYVTITGHRLEGAPADVRPIDPERLAQVCAHYAPATPATLVQTPSGPMLDQSQVLEIRQALGFIEPDESYDTWRTCGMALAATGAPNAFGLWNEWSLQGAKYNAREMRAKWASFRGDKIQLPTLFKLAQDRGWVNSSSRAAMAFEMAAGMSLEDANRAAPPQVSSPRPARAPSAFPVQGLDDVCRWIASGAVASYPVVTQHAALCIAAAGAARMYRTPQGEPCSLYLGAASQSIGELRYAGQAVYRALEGAGLRRMIRANRMTSPQIVYRTLMRSPACVYLSDDYGALSAFSRRQPSGLQEQVLGILSALYDGSTIQLDGPEDAGIRPSEVADEQPVIFHPSLSLFALIGRDHLVTLLRASELGRGALEQILLALPEEDPIETRDHVPSAAPPWLCSHLQLLRRVPANGAQLDLGTIFQGNAGTQPGLTEVIFDAPMEWAYSEIDGVSSDRRVRPVILAAKGILRRLCAVLAAWEDPEAPRVSRNVLSWSTAYVCDRLSLLVEQFDILHGDDGKPSVYDAVLLRILDARHVGLARRDLISGCKPFRNLDSDKRGKLILQMLEDETIAEVEIKPDGKGRPGKRLVHTKFIKKDALDG